MVWSTYLQGSKGDADKENRLLETVREGEGGKIGVSALETRTAPYKVASGIGYVMQVVQSRRSVPSRGVGWGEVGERVKREGTRPQLWLTRVDVWQKQPQYYTGIVLQLKYNVKRGSLPTQGPQLRSLGPGRFHATEAQSMCLSPWRACSPGPCSAVREAGAAGSLHTQLGATPAAR